MNQFELQYITTALWSSVDDDGTPLDYNYDIDDLAPETKKQMIEDCREFVAKSNGLFGDQVVAAAHDFWLTRNGHGVGFWDGDWEKSIAISLVKLCDEFGEVHLYVGDDNKIYC